MTSAVQMFRELHQAGNPLILPNVWDAGTARIAANLGAAVIGTTSAGVAWAQGLPDGGALSADTQLRLARQLASATTLPVTMDIEDGYSRDPREVARFLTSLADAGVVGVNLEDSTAGVQRPREDFGEVLVHVRRLLAATDTEVFINARIDNYLLGTPDGHQDVLDRARTYVEAGADGIFLPGLTDLDEIRIVCSSMDVPVNVMVPAGELTVRDLSDAGVARISTGMWMAQLAFGAMKTTAAAVLDGDLATAELSPADYALLNEDMRVSPVA